MAPSARPIPGVIYCNRNFVSVASPAELEDIKARVVVRAVDQAARVDEHVRRLDDLRPIWPVINEASGGGGHERTNLVRSILIADIEHAHAGVLVGRENQVGANEASGPVFVDVVRAEMTAL